MIFRIGAIPRPEWVAPGTVAERRRFLFLPKSIKHGDQHVVRWLEHAVWAAESSYDYPNTALSECMIDGHTRQRPNWKATKWLDIEEAAVEGLNKLNTVSENQVEQYPYK